MNEIHYAPYGPNRDGTFDCGEKCGGYTDDASKVTCIGCMKKSPGLWPEHQEKALDRDTLEAVAKLADERKLPYFAQDIRDLGKPRVKIRLTSAYIVGEGEKHLWFFQRESAEAYIRDELHAVPEMDYSDEVVELTEADVVPEEGGLVTDPEIWGKSAKPANGPGPTLTFPDFCSCDLCREHRRSLEAEACAR